MTLISPLKVWEQVGVSPQYLEREATDGGMVESSWTSKSP